MEREFKMTLGTDSTAEIGDEIDTDIAAGSKFAWAIVGMRWAIEKIAAPHEPVAMGGSATTGNAILQLVRGALPAVPILIGRQDHDLIGEDIIETFVATSVGVEVLTWPREVMFQGVTQLPTLHVTFGTVVDYVALSAVTNRIVGSVLYHLVSAPKARHEDL